jgi:heme-degrading monooxygenase HmoA
MYARSTTVRGTPQAIHQGICHVRNEVMPALQQLSGYVGLSMLVDRGSGRCIVTSAWADEASMRATEQRVEDLRRRTAEVLGGPYEAHAWEIAALHRIHGTHHGACTRVIWTRGEPGRLAPVIDAWRSNVLPELEEMEGFCSVSLLVERASGRAVYAVTYDDRGSMERATSAGTALRERFARETGVEIAAVAEFDVAVAYLRVPEMA